MLQVIISSMHKDKKDNLIHFKSKWNYPRTKVIRVPENLSDQLLEIAHKLDSKESIKDSDNSLLQVKVAKIIAKIDSKESGYKTNSASRLIAEIKTLLSE